MDLGQAEELAKTLSQMKQILQGTQGMPSLSHVAPPCILPTDWCSC